jgi:hypothetical protein
LYIISIFSNISDIFSKDNIFYILMLLKIFYFISDKHTHAHTHTHKERERERGGRIELSTFYLFLYHFFININNKIIHVNNRMY